tara:strand:+ start:156 stop:413 length:258 start_codon:yes stop_codon:yes gene_type:complete
VVVVETLKQQMVVMDLMDLVVEDQKVTELVEQELQDRVILEVLVMKVVTVAAVAEVLAKMATQMELDKVVMEFVSPLHSMIQHQQ